MKALRSAEDIMISNNLTVDHGINVEDIDNIIQAIKVAQREALEAAYQNATLTISHVVNPTDQPHFSVPASEQNKSVWINKDSILKLLTQ